MFFKFPLQQYPFRRCLCVLYPPLRNYNHVWVQLIGQRLPWILMKSPMRTPLTSVQINRRSGYDQALILIGEEDLFKRSWLFKTGPRTAM